MNTSLVTVATFWSLIEANLAKSRLEGHGIQAFLEGENFVATSPWDANAVGGIKLQVKHTDDGTAREILGEDV